MSTDRTLVIVPTYNERENLPRLLTLVLSAVPDVRVLVVDDNSPDGTADLVDDMQAGGASVSVLRRSGPRGLGRSYVDGYRHALAAGYARAAQMDADLSHAPRYLPDLLAASTAADVVLGSRYCAGGGVRNWPVHRLLLSRFANQYVAAVTGLPVRDSTSGYRCYTRRALETIQVDQIVSNGYAFQVEMTYRAVQAGLRLAEVPIEFVDRCEGTSKISRTVLLESMLMPWRLRLSRRYARTLGPAGTPIPK